MQTFDEFMENVSIFPTNYKLVDTTRFDIIEKVEAKIKRLEDSLETLIGIKNHYQTLVDNYVMRTIEISDDIDKIKKELDEIEGAV